MKVIVEERSRPVHREYIRVRKVLVGQERRKMLQIDLLSQGNLYISLLQHFCQFYSSPWVREGVLNRFFILAVQYYFLSDRHLPLSAKITEEAQQAVKDIMSESERDKYVELKQAVKKLCQTQYNKMQKLRRDQELQLRRRHESWSQLQALELVQMLKRQLLDEAINDIMAAGSLEYGRDKFIGDERIHLRSIGEALMQLSITRSYFRRERFYHFLTNTHATYYSIICDNRLKVAKPFFVRRLTENSNQYVISLLELIATRGIDRMSWAEGQEIMRQILDELKRYRGQTGLNYPQLQLKSVFLNQLTLRVHLGLENPIYEALGLLQRPLPVEARLVFRATPEPYDLLFHPSEHHQPYMFYNHLAYGQENMPYMMKAMPNEKELLAQMSQIHDKLVLQSSMWRLLLMFSQLLGKNWNISINPIDEQLKRRESLLQDLKNVGKRRDALARLLGQYSLNEELEKIEEVLDISFIEQLLGKEQQDSLIGAQADTIAQRVRKCHRDIFKMLLDAVQKSGKQEPRVPNTIVYLFRFYLGLFCELSQLTLACTHFQGILPHQKRFAKKILLSAKPRYIDTAITKFIDYQKRHKVKPEEQVKLLIEDPLYRRGDQLRQNMILARQKLKQNAQKYQITKIAKEVDSDSKIWVIDASKGMEDLIQRFFTNKKENKKNKNKSDSQNVKVLLQMALKISEQNCVLFQTLLLPIVQNPQSSAQAVDYALEILKDFHKFHI